MDIVRILGAYTWVFLLIKKDSWPISRVLYALYERQGCLPFIQDLCHHRPQSFYPPAWAGYPLLSCAGLHELSTLGMYSANVTISLVGSYSTFSPLPFTRRLFSSTFAGSREPLPVRKRDALCCPDFPLVPLPLASMS